MSRYAMGDSSAFAELYKLLSSRLFRFCLRLSRSRAEADDLFQETLLRVHRARGTYEAGRSALCWVFAIARSAHVDRARWNKARPDTEGSEPVDSSTPAALAGAGPAPDVALSARALLMLVDRELARMSEKNRSAYVLLREEEFSAAEAAATLGTTVEVVKQRAHRAYEQIREALRAEGWRGDEG